MDAACALIAEADAAARPPATTKAEASVRDWWAARRAGAPGRPVSGTGAPGAGAETRWPMAVTLVLAMAVPLLLPARFSLGPSWAVPAAEALLLVAIVAIDRGRIDRRSAAGRALSLALVTVLVIDAAGVTGRLIVDLVEGGPETNSAEDLLKTGFLVWLYTIIAFAFLYSEVTWRWHVTYSADLGLREFGGQVFWLHADQRKRDHGIWSWSRIFCTEKPCPDQGSRRSE